MTGYNTHIVPMRTRRWNDRRLPGDGLRLLICRFRPRGVRKEEETWDEWDPNLGPSRELHADAYGKRGREIDWQEYEERYLREMKEQVPRIQALAERVRRGETITLLCSSACEDDGRCHRSLLRALIEEAVAR
jgi:uncharacterized protein YeaO (DUF488 family)